VGLSLSVLGKIYLYETRSCEGKTRVYIIISGELGKFGQANWSVIGKSEV